MEKIKSIDLEDLNKRFDKVVFTHRLPTDDHDGTTVAALVKGDNVYIGISNCSYLDQFSRPMGRKIALRRAEFASNNPGVQREKAVKRGVNFYYTMKANEHTTADDIIKAILFSKEAP